MLSRATSTLAESSLRNALTGATVTFSRTVNGWKTRSKSDSLLLGGLPGLGESAVGERGEGQSSRRWRWVRAVATHLDQQLRAPATTSA